MTINYSFLHKLDKPFFCNGRCAAMVAEMAWKKRPKLWDMGKCTSYRVVVDAAIFRQQSVHESVDDFSSLIHYMYSIQFLCVSRLRVGGYHRR